MDFVQEKFQFKIEKSRIQMFWVSCMDKNCKWFVQTRSIKKTKIFKVITYQSVDAC